MTYLTARNGGGTCLALIALVGCLSSKMANAHDNGLALTPQMGWNTWNYFGCSIDENTIVGAAERLVQLGLPRFGYNYVLIDDCWQNSERNSSTGEPLADPQKFPSGMKNVADRVHALGLKIGIYSDAGAKTCGGRFGSLGYESVDAKTYADWGIDYLKYDNCFNEGQSGTPFISYTRYKNMSDALNATGRPILYSMCNWGDDGPWNWATTIANSWRISGDIFDVFSGYDDRCPCDDMLDCKLSGFHCSVARIIDYAAPFGQKAYSGAWNDLDTLEVGNGGMTRDEYQTHFTMWAVLKSPLILGNDIVNIANETLDIITNDAIIALNQDSASSPAVRRWRRPLPGWESNFSSISGTPSVQLWSGGLNNGSTVAVVLNTGDEDIVADVSFADIFKDSSEQDQTREYSLTDLWQKSSQNIHKWGRELGVHRSVLKNVKVRRHGVQAWKLVPVSSKAFDSSRRPIQARVRQPRKQDQERRIIVEQHGAGDL